MTALVWMHDKLPAVVDDRLVVTAETPLPCLECGGDGLMEVVERWGPFRPGDGVVTDCDACDGSGLAPVGTVVIHGETLGECASCAAFYESGEIILGRACIQCGSGGSNPGFTRPGRLLMVTTLTSQVKLCNCHESEQCATGTKGRWLLTFEVVEVFPEPITTYRCTCADGVRCEYPSVHSIRHVAGLPSGVSVAPSGLYEAVGL